MVYGLSLLEKLHYFNFCIVRINSGKEKSQTINASIPFSNGDSQNWLFVNMQVYEDHESYRFIFLNTHRVMNSQPDTKVYKSSRN